MLVASLFLVFLFEGVIFKIIHECQIPTSACRNYSKLIENDY